jgi:hypothetical protein
LVYRAVLLHVGKQWYEDLKRNVNTKQQRRLLLTSQFALIVIDRSIRRCKLTKNWFLDLPILRDKNYQQLNGRIRSFTVLSWYCKTFIDDAHALFRDSDYSILAVHDCFKHAAGQDIPLLDWRQVLSYDVSFLNIRIVVNSATNLVDKNLPRTALQILFLIRSII